MNENIGKDGGRYNEIELAAINQIACWWGKGGWQLYSMEMDEINNAWLFHFSAIRGCEEEEYQQLVISAPERIRVFRLDDILDMFEGKKINRPIQRWELIGSLRMPDNLENYEDGWSYLNYG